MLDATIRLRIAPVVEAVARRLVAVGISAQAVTALAFAAGAGACIAAAFAAWTPALALWLVSRVLDGLDGAVARLRTPTDIGGFLDIVGDFTVYAGFVAGVAVSVPGARLACVVLLCAYYVSGTAFLAFSSLAERRRIAVGDERSVRFVGGLAEGFETILVYSAICLAPAHAAPIAWGFAVIVAFTAAQRIVGAVRLLV